jgi:hypothetical protein
MCLYSMYAIKKFGYHEAKEEEEGEGGGEGLGFRV